MEKTANVKQPVFENSHTVFNDDDDDDDDDVDDDPEYTGDIEYDIIDESADAEETDEVAIGDNQYDNNDTYPES